MKTNKKEFDCNFDLECSVCKTTGYFIHASINSSGPRTGTWLRTSRANGSYYDYGSKPELMADYLPENKGRKHRCGRCSKSTVHKFSADTSKRVARAIILMESAKKEYDKVESVYKAAAEEAKEHELWAKETMKELEVATGEKYGSHIAYSNVEYAYGNRGDVVEGTYEVGVTLSKLSKEQTIEFVEFVKAFAKKR